MLYRLYSLGKDGLLFGLPEILEASDDKEAIEKATQCADGLYLEVWDRSLACTRFHRHRVRCFDGTGGVSWSDGSLRGSLSLRLCG
jgi:hypothetical protein